MRYTGVRVFQEINDMKKLKKKKKKKKYDMKEEGAQSKVLFDRVLVNNNYRERLCFTQFSTRIS